MPAPTEITRAARRRDAVVELIAESLSTRGYPPTVAELAGSTNVSKRTIRLDLLALEKAERVERDPGVDRGLRLV